MRRRFPPLPVRRFAVLLALGAVTATTSARRDAAPPTPERPVSTTPLLREGSRVVQIVGLVEPDAPRAGWRFIVDKGGPASHEFVLLPCTYLDELVQMLASVERDRARFELTGEVYVYRDRNYLLPVHAPVLRGVDGPVTTTTAPAPDADSSDGPTDGPTDGATDGDSTADIIRGLERSVGPVTRRPAAAAAGGAIDDDRSPRLVREGVTMLDRRGTVHRTGGGAFVFIFDADAEGLADPPMILLPCLLLERLEEQARRRGADAALLLSGRTSLFDGRNYLLPTIYRLPRERTVLAP